MWVIETVVEGEPVSWELSHPVPRNDAGEPVEGGSLDPSGSRVVVGSRDTFDTMVAFLKERSGAHVRVSKVEAAWAAAERRGSARERVILQDGTPPPSAQLAHPARADAAGRDGPSSPLTGVFVLLVLGALVYFALQLM